MPQYLVSVHMVEGEPLPPEDVIQQMHKDVDAFNDGVKVEGRWVFAGGGRAPPAAMRAKCGVRSGNGGKNLGHIRRREETMPDEDDRQ